MQREDLPSVLEAHIITIRLRNPEHRKIIVPVFASGIFGNRCLPVVLERFLVGVGLVLGTF